MALCFDKYVAPDQIPTTGISKITADDIKEATEAGKKIKLIGRAVLKDGEVEYSVQPLKLDASHPPAGVSNEFNAVYITGDMVGELMFYGRGAGPLPTGSAVCGDILSIMKSKF
jgi:homoserine dehydrogenase